MSASKLHPNVWNDEELDGGVLFKNRAPKSAKAPHWIGRIYLRGIGWYWLSAWTKEDGSPMLRLRAKEMSDAEARKYCAPKHTDAKPRPPTKGDEPKEDSPKGQTDIPF